MVFQKRNIIIGIVVAVVALIGLALMIWRYLPLTKKQISLNIITLSGKITLPAGLAIKPSDLHVSTMVAEEKIKDNGDFSLEGFDGGRQLSIVTNDSGQPLFMGFIASGASNTIGANSTAEVLLFQWIGATYLPYSSWTSVIDALQSFSQTDGLVKKIEAIASKDPNYLTDDNKQLTAEILAAIERLKHQTGPSVFFRLFGVPNAKAAGIDAQEKSGVRIDSGIFNDVKVTNAYRRIVRANFYEIGYKRDGKYNVLPSPKFAKSVVAPTVGKLTDLASTVYDLIVHKVHYAEQSSPPVFLDGEPGADTTTYKVIGLGWGHGKKSPDGTWKLTEQDQNDLQEITAVTLFQEVVFPIFMMGISTDKASQLFEGNSKWNDFIAETARWMLTDPNADNEGGKAVLDKLVEGDLNGATAAVMEFIAKSETFRKRVGGWIALKVAAKFGETAAVKFLSTVSGVFAKPVEAVNLVLKGFDATLLSASFYDSNQVEEWEIETRPAKITLTPQSAKAGEGDKINFKVEVQTGEEKINKDTGEVKINLVYEWYHKNDKMGEFEGRIGDVYVSTKNTAVYVVKDDKEDGDTIDVKVYWLHDTGTNNERLYLGSKTAQITKGESGSLDKFVQCLRGKGVKLYSASWCSHCQNQIALFGNSAKMLPVVECFNPGDNITSEPRQICKSKNIIGYPTWEFFDGSTLSGLQQLEALSEKSGCKL